MKLGLCIFYTSRDVSLFFLMCNGIGDVYISVDVCDGFICESSPSGSFVIGVGKSVTNWGNSFLWQL